MAPLIGGSSPPLLTRNSILLCNYVLWEGQDKLHQSECIFVYHVKPDQHSTFDVRGKEAWYKGPAPEHYRCVTIFILETRWEIQVGTVQYFQTEYQSQKLQRSLFSWNLLLTCLNYWGILLQPCQHWTTPISLQQQLLNLLNSYTHCAALQPKVHVPVSNDSTENIGADLRVEPSLSSKGGVTKFPVRGGFNPTSGTSSEGGVSTFSTAKTVTDGLKTSQGESDF